MLDDCCILIPRRLSSARNSLAHILWARGYMLRTIYKYRKRRCWSI